MWWLRVAFWNLEGDDKEGGGLKEETQPRAIVVSSVLQDMEVPRGRRFNPWIRKWERG